MTIFTTCLASAGVIGGADGPTVVYVTGQRPLLLFTAIAICAVILALLIFLALRRRK